VWDYLRIPVCENSKFVIKFFYLLRVARWFEADVSGLPIGPIFKVQAVFFDLFFDSLTFQYGTDR
jgi:hypothetical protein